MAGRLSGTASVTGTLEGLRYHEHGTLSFGTHSGPAEQHYRFVSNAGAKADIVFDDGRPFHTLDLSCGIAVALHECPPDRYEGRYRVFNRRLWIVSWRIAGPRKQMLIASRYARDLSIP